MSDDESEEEVDWMEFCGATEQEVEELREIFNLVDLDHGGSIDDEELGELMDLLGYSVSESDITAMVEEIDQSGEGEIDFKDFVRVMSRKLDAKYQFNPMMKSFKLLAGPAAQSGYIAASTLHDLLVKHTGEAEATKIINLLDPDENGMVNYNQYVSMMLADRAEIVEVGGGHRDADDEEADLLAETTGS